MSWNDVVANMRQKLQRGFGLGRHDVPVVRGDARLEQLGDTPLATPAADVFESDKELLIRADVPGGSPENAIVSWEGGQGLRLLVKTGQVPAGSPWASEYQPHDWYRAFELPEYADGAKATSNLKHGVLTVRVPKRAATSKLIPVKAG